MLWLTSARTWSFPTTTWLASGTVECLHYTLSSLTQLFAVAGRTALSSVIDALQRIAFNGDPLQFMLIQTTYQPFISIFHMTDIVQSHPELAAIREWPAHAMIGRLFMMHR